jgi:hypothetical protein
MGSGNTQAFLPQQSWPGAASFAYLAKGAGFDFALPVSPNRPTEGQSQEMSCTQKPPPARNPLLQWRMARGT